MTTTTDKKNIPTSLQKMTPDVYEHTFSGLCFKKTLLIWCMFCSTVLWHYHTTHTKKYAHGSCSIVYHFGSLLLTLSKSPRVASLELKQSYDCPDVREATLKTMNKINIQQESIVLFHNAFHYNDVIMSAIASKITSLTIVYSTVYPDAGQRKHQSPASLAFVWGIHRGPVNSPHKWPVTRKMFPFDDVIMFPLAMNSNERILAHML